MNIKKLFDRPIAYHRSLVPIAGVTGAVMLSQAIYWSARLPDSRNGWFYKTRDEWLEETGLTRFEQEGARKKLKKSGVLKEQLKGQPARMWYKIDYIKLEQILSKLYQQDGGKPANKMAENQPTILYTENTPEKGEKEKKPSKDLQGYLKRKAHRKVLRTLKRKYGGTIPGWVNVDKKVEEEVAKVPVSVTITQKYRDFCKAISEDRKAIHIPTVEGQRLWDNLIEEGYKPAHIKGAARIAYRVDEYWKNNFTPELFFRKKAQSTGQAIDHIGKYVNWRAGSDPEITKIKQEMKNELSN